jgi:hypothetical protein
LDEYRLVLGKGNLAVAVAERDPQGAERQFDFFTIVAR